MKIVSLKKFKNSKRYKQVMNRGRQNYAAIFPIVKKIMAEVKKDGDVAIKKYTLKFDGVKIKDIRVNRQEIRQAYKDVSQKFIRSMEQACKNITRVSGDQIPQTNKRTVEPATGINVWTEWRPIEKVGLYVPGGKAFYPSSVLMNAIPAKIAGCKQIIITTPPQINGKISPELLVTADKLGIKEIYKVGGVQAIAALTYGTKTIPKVYKIVGPGNAYVAAAKLTALMSGEVAIDSPAGPSEVFIIADETANPKFVAADLMCDAEHGDDSVAVLITTSKKLAGQVIREIKNRINQFSTKDRIKKSIKQYGLFATVDSIDEAVDFANNYAPEHIQIMTAQANKVAKKIINAGSVFIGDYTCKSAGDYATGANHVLPTGGSAKMFAGLSVLDFIRPMEYQQCTKQGLKNIKNTIETFAEVEKLPAHKYSCSMRFND